MEWLKSLTPPEWGEWNIWGRLAYLVVLIGIVSAAHFTARWLVYGN